MCQDFDETSQYHVLKLLVRYHNGLRIYIQKHHDQTGRLKIYQTDGRFQIKLNQAA